VSKHIDSYIKIDTYTLSVHNLHRYITFTQITFKKKIAKNADHIIQKNINQNINLFFVSRWIAWSTRNTYAQIYKHIYTNHIIKTRYLTNMNHVIKTNTQIRYEFVTKETLLSRPRICEKRDITQIRITLSKQTHRSDMSSWQKRLFCHALASVKKEISHK